MVVFTSGAVPLGPDTVRPDTVGPTGDTPFYLSDMAVVFGPSLGGARGPSQGRSHPADETDIFNEKNPS